MTEQDLSEPQGRRGIQSVEIGLRVIEALSQGDRALTLGELARASGIRASNCHRYLASFVRAGFVVQDPLTSRYDFGPRLVQAGVTALSRLDSVSVGVAALARLVDETGHSGLLAVWGDAGPVIVRWMDGRRAVRTNLSTGSSLPLLRSASGRIFLAWRPSAITTAQAAREAMAQGDDPVAIAQAVRATGVATVQGSYIPGLNAVAAPLLDAHGEAAAAITLVGLPGSLNSSDVELLRKTASAASSELGWRPPATEVAS